MAAHIAQNTAERCQEYFLYFIANNAKYFIVTLQFQLSDIFLKKNKYFIVLEIL